MDTNTKHSIPEWVKSLFAIFDMQALRCSPDAMECLDIKNNIGIGWLTQSSTRMP